MKRALILMLVLLAALSLPAADRELVEVLEQLGATCEWDPLREAGVILAGSDRIAFQVGTAFVLLNYTERLDIPAPRREGGRIVFTEEAIVAVSAAVARMRREGPAEGLRIGAIVLDPGHGGIDPGGVGTRVVGGKEVPLYEKDIVLPLALTVGERLRAVFPSKQVVYTRTDDTKIPLEERSAMANALQERIGDAVLYVAIHANASPRTKARGFDVWYLPPTYRRTLLTPENSGDDPALTRIMNSMLEEEISVESVVLAREISQALEAKIGERSPNNGLKEEAWAVVRNSRMPAVLVEIGFVTNPAEAELLSDPAYLQDIAEGLYNGIIAFIARFERAGSSGDR
ncbi:MAG TPA: N-acetylmuramoyl-L-alanine amidase [Desulfobacterales bacterium]|nr:N-acetylmuramoyl-L-alanine amidase [Desulfobacterales bacterium]